MFVSEWGKWRIYTYTEQYLQHQFVLPTTEAKKIILLLVYWWFPSQEL